MFSEDGTGDTMGAFRIDSRFLMKARYQRNFLIGTLAAVVLAITAALVLRALPQKGQVSPEAESFFPGGDGGHGTGTWASGLLPEDAPRSGFLGFVRLKPIPDAESYESATVKPFTAHLVADIRDLMPEAGRDFGLGDGVGDGTGSGVGGHDYPSDDFGLPNADKRYLVDLPSPSHRDDSVERAAVYLRPPVFPQKAIKDRLDSGVVLIQLTIRKDATIEWRVLDEQPTGYGFAQSVINALIRSSFIPKHVRGKPVDVTIPYRCVVCLICPQEVSVESNDIRAFPLRKPGE